VFGHPEMMPGWRVTAEDASVANQMSSAWVAFVKGNDPSAVGLPAWPGYIAPHPQRIIFDVAPRVEEDGSVSRHQFLQKASVSVP